MNASDKSLVFTMYSTNQKQWRNLTINEAEDIWVSKMNIALLVRKKAGNNN